MNTKPRLEIYNDHDEHPNQIGFELFEERGGHLMTSGPLWIEKSIAENNPLAGAFAEQVLKPRLKLARVASNNRLSPTGE